MYTHMKLCLFFDYVAGRTLYAAVRRYDVDQDLVSLLCVNIMFVRVGCFHPHIVCLVFDR